MSIPNKAINAAIFVEIIFMGVLYREWAKNTMAASVKLQSSDNAATSVSQPLPAFLALGYGYVARAFLDALPATQFDRYATYRDPKKHGELISKDIKPIAFSGTPDKALTSVLKNTTHLLCSIPPNADGDVFIRAHQDKLARLAPKLQWVGYLSAISVYGDRKGQWVFEDELLYPSSARGRARAQAELDWLESDWPVHVFRLAGFYGPGINAVMRIKNGLNRAIITQNYISNRVHIDDIVAALLASIARPHPLHIYNVADDLPAPAYEPLNYAAHLLGPPLEQIPVADAHLSKMALSFYADSRRVSNTRLKQELDWQPKYPSYKEGLRAHFKNKD
jgi:dTDP-4-dehydrorhamnose reductase